MKVIVLIAGLLPVLANCSAAGDDTATILVSFAIDGKVVTCNDSKVELSFRGTEIVPEATSGGFVVPAMFNKKASKWPSDENVKVYFTCGTYKLDFQVYPSWVSPGSWKFGVEYPPHLIEFDKRVATGTWVSYLDSECNECDPGVVTWLSHPDPPSSVVTRLQHEQPAAVGGRARDIAYGLAVFKINYEQNRDYLVRLMDACLSRPKESSEDEICDGTLLDYITNLYWRGDSALLEPLLQIADSRRDVIDEVGTFYANLLDARTAAILQAMQGLPIEKQKLICHLAGEFELSLDSPKLDRVSEHLRSTGGQVADRYIEETQRAAKRESSPTEESR